ncbi:16S rRNA (guanine(966)-N(2))-methyltransferase RsmD [Aerococcaceae bacterium WGS1372]
MRVIAGKYGSRPIKSVPGLNTRPTTDKIKESMFNLMGGFFNGGVCLDFYSGSGALAIEAVSRGMDKAVLCERHRSAISTIEANIQMTKEEDRFTLLKGDNHKSLEKYLKKNPSIKFDLVLIDPPYAKEKIESDIMWLKDLNCIHDETLIVCESDIDTSLQNQIADYHLLKDKEYGTTHIRIYSKEES